MTTPSLVPEIPVDAEAPYEPHTVAPLLAAADMHNFANNQPRILSPSYGYSDEDLTAWDSVSRFVRASAYAGVNEIYNMAQTVGSWATRSDPNLRELSDYLQTVDSNLVDYYANHQDSINTVGFIGASFLPGMGGVKLLNVGQSALRSAVATGKIGSTMGRGAVGLLAPNHESLLKKAVVDIASSDTPFKLTRASVLKNLGAGLWQNTLEAGFFELAVGTTMYNSPILETQSVKDIFWNGVTFAGVGGVIGGAFSGAARVGKIKAGIRDIKERFSAIAGAKISHELTPGPENFLFYLNQKNTLPKLVEGTDEFAAYGEQLRTRTIRDLDMRMLEAATEITQGDPDLAKVLWQGLKDRSDQEALDLLGGGVGGSRLGHKLNTELELAALGKKDITSLTPDELMRTGNLGVRYFVVTGERQGDILSSAPTNFRLADTLDIAKKQKIEIKGNTVVAGERRATFSLNDNWNIFAVDHLQAEMRQIWAKSLPKFKPDTVVGSTDLPLLEKMYREFDTSFKVRGEDGLLRTFGSQQEFKEWLFYQKQDLATRLVDVASEDSKLTTQQLVAKLKSELAIDFDLVDDPTFIATYARDINVMSIAGMGKQVVVSKQALATTPFPRLVQAIKHEQGHSFFQSLIDSSTLSIDDVRRLRPEMELMSKRMRPEHWRSKGADINYLRFSNRPESTVESAHELMADSFAFASMHPKEAARIAPEWYSRFGEIAHPVPQKLLDAIIRRKVRLSQDEIAAIVNVNPSVLSGTRSLDDDIFFADQYASKKYTEALVARGERHANEPVVDIHKIPSVVKVGYDTTPVMDYDGNQLKGMLIVQHKQQMYQDHINNVFEAFMPEGTAKYFPSGLGYNDALSANIVDSPGRGFAYSSNAPYATIGNVAEFVGKQSQSARIKAGDNIKAEISSVASAMLKNESAAIEWSVLQARVRNIPEHYVLDPEGVQQLKLKKIVDFEAKVARAQAEGGDITKIKPPQIEQNIPYTIEVKNRETFDVLKTHIIVDEKRMYAHTALNAAEGVENMRLPGVFYPPAPNARDYRHFAFVEDTSVIGTGRKRMIYAQTAEALDALIQSLRSKLPEHIKVRTRKETEEFFKASGKFDYEQTLDDIDFDRTLKRAGFSGNELPATDPAKIVDDWINWNVDREHALVTRLVSAKYQPVLDTIKRQGDGFTNVATSIKGSSKSLARYAEAAVDNPYADYIRTFLGFPRTAPFADFWFTPQKRIEQAFSNMWGRFTEMLTDAKGARTSGEQLEKINSMMREHGYGGVAYDEIINQWVNHTAPRDVLSSFARKSNSIVAALALRLDHLNAWVNAISSNILYHPEISKLIKAIESGDSGTAGKLAGWADSATVAVPGTGGDRILSPLKLQARAMSTYFTELGKGDKSELIQMYKDIGIITSYSDQFRYIMDELTLTGRETAHDMLQREARLTKIHNAIVETVNKGETLTLNKHAEELNRFVAAESVRPIFQAAADKGLISQGEVLPSVYTFVRRTQGTYDAFLRPAVFQGPVGQFIGLFQTYQFNLMQQLLRHVEDGYMKSAMLMMGLQGSIWGLQGMPAFNAINTHLVGKAAGNKENKDIYSTVYSGPSVEAAEWIMYGGASNLLGLVNDDLKVNIYSRGDINPRHLTVLPTSIEDIPTVNAIAKTLGGIKAGLSNASNGGGIWQSILTGLEHSSLNRPMAGFAQVLQATDNPYGLSFGTTNKGNIVMANELYSIANLARLAGGKPFDEAVLRDLEYRSQIYSTHMENKRNTLGRAIKAAAYAGKPISHEQVVDFAQKWVHIGGDITRFNQFMLDSMTKGNRDMNQRLAETLKSPTLQRLQKQMGGEDNVAVTQEGLPAY